MVCLFTGIVASCEVVSSIFFATNKLFWMKKLAVCSCSDFIDDSGFKIYKNGTGNMFPSTCFTKKGVESIITTPNSLVTWHLPIRLSNPQHNIINFIYLPHPKALTFLNIYSPSKVQNKREFSTTKYLPPSTEGNQLKSPNRSHLQI